MRTTLLVEKNDQLQSFFSINLHTWVGSQVMSYNDVANALNQINESNESFDLIIARSHSLNDPTPGIIVEFLANSKLRIPLIVVGEYEGDTPGGAQIDSCLDIKKLIQVSAKALKVTAQDMANLSVPDFFPIPISFFHSLKYSVTDVYFLDSESKEYNMAFKMFDQIDSDFVKGFISQGESLLYVKKEDRLKFVTNLTQEIVSVLSLKDLNDDEQISAMEMSQKLLQQKIARVGINNDTIQLAQHNLKNMVSTTKKIPALLRLIKRMLKNKAGYQFKHSQVLMLVASHLMEHMDWGTPEQLEKLQFITFFHDIALEDDEQAQIHTEEQLRSSSISKQKKELVKKHAQIAASLVAQYPKAPMGSELIIKQHHGIAHGVGFSETYSANLSPMAIVFILSEDFTDEVLKSGIEFDIKAKINQMRKRFTTQRFQKIIDVLESITLT